MICSICARSSHAQAPGVFGDPDPVCILCRVWLDLLFIGEDVMADQVARYVRAEGYPLV